MYASGVERRQPSPSRRHIPCLSGRSFVRLRAARPRNDRVIASLAESNELLGFIAAPSARLSASVRPNPFIFQFARKATTTTAAAAAALRYRGTASVGERPHTTRPFVMCGPSGRIWRGSLRSWELERNESDDGHDISRQEECDGVIVWCSAASILQASWSRAQPCMHADLGHDRTP